MQTNEKEKIKNTETYDFIMSNTFLDLANKNIFAVLGTSLIWRRHFICLELSVIIIFIKSN